MIHDLFDFIQGAGHVSLICLLWAVAWLIPTYVMAYVLRLTAPGRCLKGATLDRCMQDHFLCADRGEGWHALAYGLAWPVWILFGMGWLVKHSLDKSVEVTPDPKALFLVRIAREAKPPLDPAITSGSKTTEELLNEMAIAEAVARPDLADHEFVDGKWVKKKKRISPRHHHDYY